MSNLQAVIIWPRELASCVLGMAGKEGAVNGSQGTVYDIIYGEDQGPPSMPIGILVRFKTVSGGEIYSGPSYVAALDCKRTYFPLDLAYATTTIHKSQGPTFPLLSTREKRHSNSIVVFCPAFERAAFRKTKGATPPR